MARLDKQLPPRQIWTAEADSPRYGAQGEIFCRATDKATRQTFIYRIKADGSEPQPASSRPVLFLMSASSDGQWLIASAAPEVTTAPIRVFAFPSAGGTPVAICTACHADWTFDGSALVVRIEGQPRTLILPIEPGRSLPRLPANGLASPDDLAGLTHFGDDRQLGIPWTGWTPIPVRTRNHSTKHFPHPAAVKNSSDKKLHH